MHNNQRRRSVNTYVHFHVHMDSVQSFTKITEMFAAQTELTSEKLTDLCKCEVVSPAQGVATAGQSPQFHTCWYWWCKTILPNENEEQLKTWQKDYISVQYKVCVCVTNNLMFVTIGISKRAQKRFFINASQKWWILEIIILHFIVLDSLTCQEN